MKKNYFYKIQTENEATEFSDKSNNKIKSYGTNPLPISEALKNSILGIAPTFSGQIDIRNSKSREQSKLVREKDLHLVLLYRYNKCFIYTLNGQIDLGYYPGTSGFKPEDRLYYGLDIKQTSLPVMKTQSQIIRVANELIAGETKRVADGGNPILMPTVTQITNTKTNVETKINLLLPAKEELNTAQNDVTATKNTIIDLYDQLYDELKIVFRNLEPEECRKLMREWGIVFTGDKETGEYVFGTVTTDGSALDETYITFKEINLTIKNNSNGTYGTHKVPPGIYTVIFTREFYNDVIVTNFEVKHEIPNLLNCEMTLKLG